jgi:hypothetical protein
MALKLVRRVSEVPQEIERQKSREECLITCLREERQDPKFSDWERQFIGSLAKQMDQGRKPTDKQKKILERIWKK